MSGFSGGKEIGGYNWFYGFMKHHDELHVKNGVTNLSLARALGSSQCIINQWFDMCQSLLEQLNIMNLKYILNIDDHGSEDMEKVKKVVGIKGIKQYQMQPREKPRQTTMLTYVNAAGFALPPRVIHRGKYHDSWHIATQPYVLVQGSKKGYINKKLFAQYGKMLIYHLHASSNWTSLICC